MRGSNGGTAGGRRGGARRQRPRARRNARAALTRVPSALMFMLMKPAPGRQGPFMSSRMGIPISHAA